MSRIETEVYKEEDNDLIGLKVITYDDDTNRVIDEIVILNPEDFIALQNDLSTHNHDNVYVTIDSVDSEIRNIAEEFFDSNTYRPPTLRLEDNGDLYVDYHGNELVNVYTLDISKNITNNNATIEVILLNSGVPQPNRTMKLIENDTLLSTAETNTDGKAIFNITVNQQRNVVIQYKDKISETIYLG